MRVQQGTGRGAGAQHSQSLVAWFAHVPGLKTVAPSTPADAAGLLKAAIRDNDPVLFIEHKGLYARRGLPALPGAVVPIGVADVKREGTDITVVAWSNMVHSALDATGRLAEEGVSVEVVDLRTISPMDTATILESVRRTGRLLVVHEAVRTGGLGAEGGRGRRREPPCRTQGAGLPAGDRRHRAAREHHPGTGAHPRRDGDRPPGP